MRILFVADGRSPIALQWIEYFTKTHEVHLVSTFSCQPELKLASLNILPVAFSAASSASTGERRGLRRLLSTGVRTTLRNWGGPFTLPAAGSKLNALVNAIKPDLVHAMRIPYEGMLASEAALSVPLLISIWGNDFTLHGRSTPFMAAATRKTMRRANALHSDTQRDLRLAEHYSFVASKPTILLPGNGGVRSEVFYPAKQTPATPRLINPRGLRAYVRNDIFFRAIAVVIKELPMLQIDCPDMQNEPEALRLVEKFKLVNHVNLLPKLNPKDLAERYRMAQVMVSPSTHDGTPNSLLEAMACGVFPIAGDLESIREWITPGKNGLLVDPANANALAAAILQAFSESNLRAQAAQINQAIIAERADYKMGMAKAEAFYEQVLA